MQCPHNVFVLWLSPPNVPHYVLTTDGYFLITGTDAWNGYLLRYTEFGNRKNHCPGQWSCETFWHLKDCDSICKRVTLAQALASKPDITRIEIQETVLVLSYKQFKEDLKIMCLSLKAIIVITGKPSMVSPIDYNQQIYFCSGYDTYESCCQLSSLVLGET